MSALKSTEDLVASVEKTYEQGLGLIKTKNQDYAGNGDPFQNFNACSIVNVSAEKALLVRMTDKMTRISNLLDRPAKVNDEKITDTLVDLCNYAAILKALIESKQEE